MHTVGIAGATGYSGQELVRLLARHPHVSLQTAMGSQKAVGGRTLPALSGLWNGEVEPYDFERLAANEVVFLALPEDASADVAPQLIALFEKGALSALWVAGGDGAGGLLQREARLRALLVTT